MPANSPRIVILGGGFVGQLIHTLFPMARCLDWRPAPPRSSSRAWGPQYLWQPIAGVTCYPREVHTLVDGVPATPESILRYKAKVGKTQDNADWRAQFQEHMPGYECRLPPDRVEYGMQVNSIQIGQRMLSMANGSRVDYDILINTIPLPDLLRLVGAEPHPFESRPIYVTVNDFPHDKLYIYVNYNSDPSTAIYRSTVRNQQQHHESLDPIPDRTCHKLMPGKIYPHACVEMLTHALASEAIFCFGRYGAWNPEELAHETFRHASNFRAHIPA